MKFPKIFSFYFFESLRNSVSVIVFFLQAMIIGIFVIMTKSGAETGMGLFWMVVLSSVSFYFLLIAIGHLTEPGGKFILFNFKTDFRSGGIYTIFLIIVLVAGELISLAGTFGIAAHLLKEQIELLTSGLDLNIYLAGALCFVLAGLFLFFPKKQQPAKTVLTGLALLSVFVFLIVLFLIDHNSSELAGDAINGIPDPPDNLILIAAISGVICPSSVLIMFNNRSERIETTAPGIKKMALIYLFPAGLMLVISGIVLSAASGTLHFLGLRFDSVREVVYLFDPIGIRAVTWLVVSGIFVSALLSLLVIIPAISRLIGSVMINSHIHESTVSQILLFWVLALFGCGVLLTYRLPAFFVVSQAIRGSILPFVTLPLLILITRRKKDWSNGPKWFLNSGLLFLLLYSALVVWSGITVVTG